ncbi:MAG: biosynthetic-type acetolactate synthase large subunit [Acidiferrobacter sp.]
MMVTGAERLVRLLEDQRVRVVAGIPGGAILPIYDALARSTVIRHVLARHEQAAGFIAQGLARVSGRAGVCLASSGPGATNLLTAVADAMRDSIPLIVITGQVPQALRGTDAFQEVDTCALAASVTKRTFLVRSAADLGWVIPLAFQIATSGRPGPVWIDIPKDVQSAHVSATIANTRPQVATQRGINTATVCTAAAWIETAQRPILYLGGGLIHAGAGALARALAERQDIPAVMTLMALGVLPHDHPLALGMLGMHARHATHRILDEADLLIVLGARFDDRATGEISHFCPTARVIHIDIDARELGKIRAADIAIQGDLHETLAILLPQLSAQSRPLWRARQVALQQAYPVQDEVARSARAVLHQIAANAPADTTVVTDVGQHQMWVAQYYPLPGPRRWLTSGGLGTMGFGLPVAIGAALADPTRTVLCFTGDGGLLMNIQELATLCDQDVDVKVIVFDNQSLGLVAQQQALFYRQGPFASAFSMATDFVAIARGFGVPAFNLVDGADNSRLLNDALKTRGPCLLRADIDARDHVLPIVPPGAANREAIGG